MRALLVLAAFTATAVSAQVVSNDGSLSDAYSFPLPAARGRYQPVLALAYRSNAGATAYGVGWSISDNYIDATVRATPNTDGTARIRYACVLNGASRLLVRGPDLTYRIDVSQTYFAATYSANTWTAVDSVGNAYNYSCIGQASCNRWYLTSVSDRDSNTTYYDYNI